MISSPLSPTESAIVISELATCVNKTYVYCSHRDLTDNWKTDLPDAIRGVKHYCLLHQIDPYQYYRTMSGRTQIYICNYGDSLLPCTSAEYWAATALLDDKCGEGKGAWMYRQTEDHTWSIGRDPSLSDHDFRPECGMW
ncbi:hypothetical protein UCDDA912_g10417 [Diaporthe ampelina]|uniref:Uncharacterized protein n=1 Tax=Diaporthe ampelina TaxID=1214573 RepID=A0A0G2H309_9PEZI|nr:hypothetical protein UCDDA912_g10417 [Diaporthe ampelina]